MRHLLVLVISLCTAQTFAARGDRNLMRGGWGFLFPDHNRIVNPGQLSIARGMGLEAQYQRTNQNPSTQAAIPSFVFGNGTWGFGVSGTRLGTSLTASDESSDFATAGLGVSLLKEHITFGVGYSARLDGSVADQGTVTASLNLNSSQRHGPAFGVGFSMPAKGSGAKSVAAGLGYIFSSSTNLEVNFTLNDLNQTKDFTAAAFATFSPRPVYIGVGGEYLNLVSKFNALARLGFVIGSSFDFSVLAGHTFETGAPVSYGGSVRFSF